MVYITKRMLFVLCFLVGGTIVQANENEQAPYYLTINIRSDDYGKLLLFAIDELYKMEIHDVLFLEKCDMLISVAKQVAYKSPIASLYDTAHYIQMVVDCIDRKLDQVNNCCSNDDQCKSLAEILCKRYFELNDVLLDLLETIHTV